MLDKEGKIVSIYETHPDSKEIFEIICLYNEGYIVYVPESLSLEDSIYIDQYTYKIYGVDIKYANSNICYVSEYKISGIYERIDGMCCRDCNDFSTMAASNMMDGSFLCWRCRKYPIYN